MSEVRVTITDELGGRETITKSTASASKPAITTTNVKDVIATTNATQNSISLKQITSLAAASMTMQVVKYGISNVGKWTGNSHNQAVINNGMQMLGYGFMLAKNPIMGGVTLGVQIGLTSFDYSLELKGERIASERRLARAGFSSSGEAIGYRRNK